MAFLIGVPLTAQRDRNLSMRLQSCGRDELVLLPDYSRCLRTSEKTGQSRDRIAVGNS